MPVRTVRIEIYSDLICPWCYIGQHRLHDGLKLLGDGFRSDITWRPFQLNPDMPKEGMDRKTYRTLKFGSWQRSQALDSEIADTGESLGLEFNYDRVRITPNTLAGHRLLWWARAQGRQDALARALFHAYLCRQLSQVLRREPLQGRLGIDCALQQLALFLLHAQHPLFYRVAGDELD